MNPQEIQQIKNRLSELEKWKAEKTTQQISFPLDIKSIEILAKNFMRILSKITYTAGATGNEFTSYLGRQDNQEFLVDGNPYIPYTVDISTNYISIPGYYMEEDKQVSFITTDTAPSPIDAITGAISYYVINSTGSTFQITTVRGSAPDIVNITSAGIGNQYLFSVGF